MSIQALAWALAQRKLTSSEKLTLICIANYANAEGKAWPKQSTLVDDTCLTRPTIWQAITSLKTKGLLEIETVRDGWRKIGNCYRLACNAKSLSIPMLKPLASDAKPFNTDVLNHLASPPSIDPLREPKIKDHKNDLSGELEFQLRRSIELVQERKPPAKEANTWPEDDNWLKEILETKQHAFTGQHLSCLLKHSFWDDLSHLTNGLGPAFVEQELTRMKLWLDENPARRPTPRGTLRFCRRWFERAAERRRLQTPTNGGHSNGATRRY